MEKTIAGGANTLSDREIVEMIRSSESSGQLRILRDNVPIAEDLIRGASVDLHLANEFKVLRPRRLLLARRPFDLGWENEATIETWYRSRKVTREQGLVLRSQEVALAKTEEYVEIPPSLCAFITGRSSYARLGIEVQCTQDLMGPGRHKTIPLQLVNNAPFPIRIYPGMRICQLVFARLGKPPQTLYGSSEEDKYQNETDLRATRFFRDPEVEAIRQVRSRDRDALRIGVGQVFVALGIAAVTAPFVLVAQGSVSLFSVGLASAGIALICIGIVMSRRVS